MGRYALLIGTDTYEHAELARLSAPIDDVERLARVLRDPQLGAFDAVTVMINRPSHELLMAIEELAADRQGDDFLLLYLSGHGIRDPHRGKLHFAAVNTQTNRLGATSVAAAFVNDQLGEATLARSRVLLLDCCFSGAFAGGLAAKAAPPTVLHDIDSSGYVVMTASDEYSAAYEDATADARSIFTDVIVEGLTSGAADVDRDGIVSTNDLFDYAFPAVTARSPQRPNYLAANVEGRIVLTYARSKPSVSLPDQTRRTPAEEPQPASVARRDYLTWEDYLEKVAMVLPDAAVGIGIDPDKQAWGSTVVGGPAGLAARLVAATPDALPAVLAFITRSHTLTAAGQDSPEHVLLQRGWYAAGHGWWEEAHTQFAAAVRQESLSVSAWWGLGCCHATAHAWPRAMESFTKAARYASATSLPTMAGATLLAVAASELGNLPGADRLLADAAAALPQCPELVLAAARVTGDSAGVAAAIDLDPVLIVVLTAVGQQHAVEGELSDVAERLEQKARRASEYWEKLRRTAASLQVELPALPAQEVTAGGSGERIIRSYGLLADIAELRRNVTDLKQQVADSVARRRAAYLKEREADKPGPPPRQPEGWFLTAKDWQAYETALAAHARALSAYEQARTTEKRLTKLDDLERHAALAITEIDEIQPRDVRRATILPC